MGKLTRKEKRDKEKEINFFQQFIIIKKHFFKDFSMYLKKIKDPRHRSYIDYEPDIMLFQIILKNAFSVTSMNKMKDQFNKEECVQNIAELLEYPKLEELPHYDTINNFLKELNTFELEKIRKYMIKELFKKRCIEKYRLQDKFWCIAIDATGLFSFKERHCEHCLTKEYKDKKTGEVEKVIYYHSVLEAKLILGKMVLSIETEFIENEKEDVSKQDCEIKAFKRLAEKLKRNYPKLPICILGDSLYACEPVFKLCESNNWKFLIRFKEGSIKSVAEEFEELKEIEEENIKISDDGTQQNIWVNGIDYKDIKINIVETTEKKLSRKKKEVTKKYVFITNLYITAKKVVEISMFGRSRWKIENEGFNNQKTIKYDLEHANCRNYNAMKNHYLLIQITDIIRQLFELGFDKVKELKISLNEISSKLLESFRTCMITVEDITLVKRLKLRFH